MNRYKVNLIALLCFIFVLTSCKAKSDEFTVVGYSMYPTFNDGDVVNVTYINTKNYSYNYNDIIVFDKYDSSSESYERDIVKRIVGLKDDEFQIYNNELYKNGEKILSSESFLENYYISNAFYKISDDELFVLGDNYHISYDSRYYGPIKKSSVIGVIKDVE